MGTVWDMGVRVWLGGWSWRQRGPGGRIIHYGVLFKQPLSPKLRMGTVQDMGVWSASGWVELEKEGGPEGRITHYGVLFKRPLYQNLPMGTVHDMGVGLWLGG